MFKRAIQKMALILRRAGRGAAAADERAGGEGEPRDHPRPRSRQGDQQPGRAKVRRAMTPGSMQEVLWQLGDMPGAVVPTEHEVFLEFEAAAARRPPVDAAALRGAATARHRDLSRAPEGHRRRDRDRDGREHHEQSGLRQPAVLHADGRAVLFTSVRGGARRPTSTGTTSRRSGSPGDEHSGERVLADGDAGRARSR